MASTAPLINTVIADDHPLIRKGFKEMLHEDPQIRLSGEAANGRELLQLLESQQPRIILLDIQMPVMNGIEAGAIIRKRYPSINLIALSVSDEERHVQAMWHLDVKGYLLKDIEAEELLLAIKTVHAGGSYYCKEVREKIDALIGNKSTSTAKEPAPVFSASEIKIIQLICKGLANKEIAAAMSVADKTVEHYKERIRTKTGAKNSTEIAVYALTNEIIQKESLR